MGVRGAPSVACFCCCFSKLRNSGATMKTAESWKLSMVTSVNSKAMMMDVPAYDIGGKYSP